MYLTNPLFFYFDKLVTEIVAYHFIYKQISSHSFKLTDKYNSLNEYILSILPYVTNNGIKYYYEIVVPLNHANYSYKTKFIIDEHIKALDFLTAHHKYFTFYEYRESLLENNSLDY